MADNKEIALSMRDKQEYAFTRKRVVYGNSFLDNMNVKDLAKEAGWYEPPQVMLHARLSEARIPQIIAPVRLDADVATDFLFRNPDINKIHSCHLDFYEELPYRPDVAFDLVWRSLESLIRLYSHEAWNRIPSETHKLFGRISGEAIGGVLNDSPKLRVLIEGLLRTVPIGVCRYALVRMLLDREISTGSQFGYIKDRAIEILGQELYDNLSHRFVKDGSISAEDNYAGAIVIGKIIAGDGFHLDAKSYSPLSLEQRLNIVVSLILYTSRCERFHGDNFSHFKSDRSSLSKTYRSWYWLLTTSYFLFWLLFHKLCLSRKYSDVVTEEALIASFEETMKRIASIFLPHNGKSDNSTSDSESPVYMAEGSPTASR